MTRPKEEKRRERRRIEEGRWQRGAYREGKRRIVMALHEYDHPRKWCRRCVASNKDGRCGY